MNKARSKQRQHGQSKIRIIAGQWRRRLLPVCELDGLRPTGDRVRETLFNWLATELYGAACLDLYAGSGALGLEALSRGAGFVQFIETHSQAASQLKDNLLTLKAEPDRWQLYNGDAVTWLKQQHNKEFKLVFVDPPFAAELWQTSLTALVEQKLLADEALIYVESPNETKFELPEGFVVHKQLKAGAVTVQLFRYLG
ncbi:16S rRNA (guanine(966)-N(2))-methyltransferase RsmD [Agaribacterium haliotis]|uniref:16S rRNA (guanine(966)-N(2))-methyltransferase RsmD n=1 Tax=Agaribacterium haliotis TaxID=2013869 RepID=UPI000BB54E7E|nr:16S rRNA (guanine(966)-N(2))-methyltransferase RsmD [Agaribacterium haliotis]